MNPKSVEFSANIPQVRRRRGDSNPPYLANCGSLALLEAGKSNQIRGFRPIRPASDFLHFLTFPIGSGTFSGIRGTFLESPAAKGRVAPVETRVNPRCHSSAYETAMESRGAGSIPAGGFLHLGRLDQPLAARPGAGAQALRGTQVGQPSIPLYPISKQIHPAENKQPVQEASRKPKKNLQKTDPQLSTESNSVNTPKHSVSVMEF
jgi:hypothetical protein